MPENAGIQGLRAQRLEEGRLSAASLWIPAFAGMTMRVALDCIARCGGGLAVALSAKDGLRQEAGFFGWTRLRVFTSTLGPSARRTTAPQRVRTSCSVSSMR